MAQRHRASHGSLFLMELIFSILLFTIIATICISGFVKAHTLSRDASLQTHYATMAGNVAEVIRSGDNWDSTIEEILAYYPQTSVISSDGSEETLLSDSTLALSSLPRTIHIYFDKDFHPCGIKAAAYCAEVNLSYEDALLTADIGIRIGGNTAHVYELSIDHFFHRVTEE
ncbi:MAG: hypothetical protein II571_04305 [Lachnospiraceae bacterium]|nr:hypothetical protein [Lachnospiraceae bacterium]MBR0429189.1 hypothetical protein [Lachnospiraceae bacterium]